MEMIGSVFIKPCLKRLAAELENDLDAKNLELSVSNGPLGAVVKLFQKGLDLCEDAKNQIVEKTQLCFFKRSFFFLKRPFTTFGGVTEVERNVIIPWR